MQKSTKKFASILMFNVACIAAVLANGHTIGAKAKTVSALAEESTYSITEQSGLGLGINVVNAKQVNDFTTGYNVLDPKKIQTIPSRRISKNSSESYTHSTESINVLLANYKLSFKLDGEAFSFLGGLKADLENVASINYTDNMYKFYKILEHKIMRYNLCIDDYLDPKTYTDYFSDNYMNDLAALSQTNNFYDFFNKYGTHIVGSADFGGRLVATYSLASNTFILNSDISTSIEKKVQLNDLSSGIKSEIATELNTYFGTNYSESELKEGFYVKAIGGNAFASGLKETFNTEYSNWTNSFNNNDSNSIIINYSNDGLVPLWDILPTKYIGLKADMKNAFKQYYNDSKDNIIKEFKTGNTTDFAGGSGSKNDPFLIDNETHLRNIEKVSMKANYKLNNDITLSEKNWEPIGGYYCKKPFEGVLDGNWKSISGLKRSDDIAEKEHRFYFGLFGCIGPSGIVKDLSFERVNIHMDGPEVNDPSARVFIGVLAGAVYGTVNNVAIVGTCSYDICTNGISFVGGIAGVAYKAKLIDCRNYADITSGRYSGVAGGIVGFSTGSEFTNCSNGGKILSKCSGWNGDASSGGIAGEIYSGLETTFTYCRTNGTVNNEYYSWGVGYEHRTGEMYGRDRNEELK